jgi:hypothetical protein
MSNDPAGPPPESAYEYAVLRYAHDPAAGEQLNVGVLLYSREAGFLGWQLNERVKRLSEAFATFHSEQFRRVISDLERGLKRRADDIRRVTSPDALPLLDPPTNLKAILAGIYSDESLSLQWSGVRCGVTDDLGQAVRDLYDRFVAGQYDYQPRQKRDDEKVWSVYQDVLRRERVSEHLEPKTFRVDEFEYRFAYAFRNGAWHAFKPASMDYADAAGIRERVERLIGESSVLRGETELGGLYILLGPPTAPDLQAAYRNALRLLRNQIPPEHEVVEEAEAEAFGKRIAEFIRAHADAGPGEEGRAARPDSELAAVS